MAYNENSDNEENGQPTNYVHSWKSIWIYIQCYFVTIASILGTGILGLPDTAWRSGFTPFLTSFLIDYVMQALSILFFVDLLQKAQGYMLSNQESNSESVPLNESEEDLNDCQDEPCTDGSVESREGVLRNIWSRNEENYNNLHQLCLLYMHHYLWIPFDATVFLLLISVIISYSLAGPQAYAQLLGIQNFVIVIPFFVWILAFCIAIFGDIIKVTITILTLFKCSLLTAVVIVIIGVGDKVDSPIHNDFSQIGSSFLMGTVALGGVVNILPMLYVKIEPIKQQVRCFFFASFAGLTTCTIFNILWVLSVLHIVPQTAAQCRENYSQISNENGTSTTSHLLTNIIPPEDCYKYTLKRSEENGQISTVPLTDIIIDFFPEYRWVGRLTQIFIAVSLTVSYLTIGSALKSMLGGVLDAVLPGRPNSNESTSTLERVTTSIIFRPVVLLLIYVIIFVIAMLNPKGFIVVLEFAASIGLNLEVVFVVVMIQGSRKEKYRHVKAPWKLPELAYFLQYWIGAFFLFAVAYAIIKAIVSIA